MCQQTVSIRTVRTFTYRPLTPASSAASSPVERDMPVKGSKPTSKIARKPRRSNRNIAWPSKQYQKSSSSASPSLSAGLESYLLLLEQQRDTFASRCSSAASSYTTESVYSREQSPASMPE